MTMTSLAAILVLASPVVQGVTKEQGDLLVTTFDLPQGRVTVYLPDDMIAGDTISGTVIAIPSGTGQTADENSAVLTGFVIELEGQKPTREGSSPSWTLPAGITAVSIALLSRDGKTQGQSSCWIRVSQFSASPTEFSGDPIANATSPMQIRGPFDGDSSNTSASISGLSLAPIAESPRSCVFAGLPNRTGAAQIDIKEGGQNSQIHTNLVKVSLSASKRTLLAGERGTLTMSVAGLDELPDEAFPVPCTIVNQSPSVVRLDRPMDWDNTSHQMSRGNNGEEIAFYFAKIDVQPGLPATKTFNITGVRPGPFVIAGLCFNVRIHNVKKGMNVKMFQAWVGGLIASYEATIKKLEKLQEEKHEDGREINIDRKKGILDVLKKFKRTSQGMLGTAKVAVDKVLKDDAFFAMAADLITTAADMLGYTDIPIPMPGIGAIVKGIKAIAGSAKLDKVLKAAEEAEKLIEAYEKMTDAQAKADQLKKIEDALDKIKKEIDAAK